MAIVLPGRTRSSNRRRGDRLEQGDPPGRADQRLAGLAEDLAGAGGQAVPDVQHGKPGRVDRGMSRVWGMRIGSGQRAEAAGDVGPRGAGLPVGFDKGCRRA
jgi:hypothetical protein